MPYYSRVQYEADGATQSFAIPFPYLNPSTLKVYTNGILRDLGTYHTINQDTGMVDFLALPAEATTILIRRLTPRTTESRIVTWSDPADLRAESLNAADLQLLYILQEALDDIADGVGVGNPSGSGDPNAPLPPNVDSALQGAVTELSAALSAEVAARIAASTAEANARANGLLAEQTARVNAVTAEASARASAIAAEASARASELAALAAEFDTAIIEEQTTRQTAYESLASSLEAVIASQESTAAAVVTESSARAAADTAEASARTAAIAALQSAVDGKASIASLENEVSARVTAVSAETTARTTAIASLQTQINGKASIAAVEAETIARVTADETLAKTISRLLVSTNDALGAIVQESYVRATADSAEATARSSAVAALQSAIDGETAARQAAILSEQTARAEALTAEATTRSAQIASLTTALGEETTARTAAIASEASARTSADEAMAYDLSVLEAAVNDGSTGLAATRARLLTEESTRASADTAQVARLANLEASVDTPTTGLLARVSSAELAVAEAEDDLVALAATLTTVEASVASNAAAISAEAATRASAVGSVAQTVVKLLAATNDTSAAIAREEVVRATETSALSSSITTLTASVSSVSSSVSTTASALADLDGRATAHWGFKLDAGGKVVGMRAIAATGASAPEQGEIVFSGADMRSDNYTESAGVPTLGWKLTYGGLLKSVGAVLRSASVTGNYFGGSATSWASGDGIFMGTDGGEIAFRVGYAGGARIQWKPSTGWQVFSLPSPLAAFVDSLDALQGGGNTALTTSKAYGVTPSGGTGTYTYSWQRVSGSTAISPVSSTSRFTKFTSSGGTNEVIEAYYKCVVTSGGVSVDSDAIFVQFMHGTPP